MLEATLVSTKEELHQIHRLNQQNLKQNLSVTEQNEEGFVSWLYPLKLLEEMHELAPSIIVKDDKKIVGYALTTVKEASVFHPDLEVMFRHLEPVLYKGKPIFSYHFYCMGQICVAKNARGKGLVSMLYQKHKEIYSPQFEFILTEISTNNIRSQKAHEKIGFAAIYKYADAIDEWNVVVWNWQDKP